MEKKLKEGNVAIVVLVVIMLLVGGAIFLSRSTSITPTQPGTPQDDKTSKTGEFSFSNPKKSAHYESNTPEHGAVLAGVPVNVVIDFNFDLASPSSISITQNGKEYGVANTTIDSNKLTMRKNMDLSAPDGIYTVNYKACWPDGSCHEGSFQFAIDRKKIGEFKEMRRIDSDGIPEVIIRMSNTTFGPEKLYIDRGTKVTWINDDNLVHYVNTDSHPAHTYQPDMNSKALQRGESYSYIFNIPGIYPYHCSAHASVMKGAILVE